MLLPFPLSALMFDVTILQVITQTSILSMTGNFTRDKRIYSLVQSFYIYSLSISCMPDTRLCIEVNNNN